MDEFEEEGDSPQRSSSLTCHTFFTVGPGTLIPRAPLVDLGSTLGSAAAHLPVSMNFSGCWFFPLTREH